MTDAPDELEQAVSYLKGELADADRHKWLTATVDADDLRLLLSERAELLATVEGMRGALGDWAERIDAQTWRIGTSSLDAVISEMRRAALTTGEAATRTNHD